MNEFETAIEGTSFYTEFISRLPAPLDNLTFDIILVLVIAAILIIPSVVDGVRGKAVRHRIHTRTLEHEKAEEARRAEEKAEKEAEKAERERERADREAEKQADREARAAEIDAFRKIAENETKKAAVSDGSLHPFKISTRSMEPALLMNTTVYGTPALASDLAPGDVGVYRFDTKRGPVYIVHRLMRIDDDGSYIFKGDNEEKEDPPVKADQIEYKVIEKKRAVM